MDLTKIEREVNTRCNAFSVREEELYWLYTNDEISNSELQERMFYYRTNLEWVRGESELSMKGSTTYEASSDELLLKFALTRIVKMRPGYTMRVTEYYNYYNHK